MIELMNIPHVNFPIVNEINLEEDDEELIKMSTKFKCEPMYFNQGYNGSLNDCYCRQTVFEKILEAEKYLPEGYKFLIYDAYRPIEVQQALWDKYRAQIIKENPDLSEEDIDKLTKLFVSKPSYDKLKPSVHNTGGAVDLTIMKDGVPVNMGTEFDDFTEKANTDYFESNLIDKIDEEIRDNRRLLYNVMIKVGFTNLPTEWWHYDYGDNFWSYYTGNPVKYTGLLRKKPE